MNFELNNSTTSSLNSTISSFSIDSVHLDEAGEAETKQGFPEFKERFSYYSLTPQLKQSIDSVAMWTIGKGYICDSRTQVILRKIKGWGEDTFDSIIRNMIIIKKINGDSFAEIIRDADTQQLINIKPLNPSHVNIIVNDKGIITGYEYKNKKIAKENMFHMSNNRVANQIHGTSVIPVCKYIIDWKQEVMNDYRRVLHRSTIRVMYIDADDPSRLTHVKTQYADAIKNGELLIVPAKKGEAELADFTAPNPEIFMAVIRYLDSIFYEALGMPKIITGGSQEYTQADSKIGYLTFEQPVASEQREVEQDIRNQLYITLEYNKPISLKDKVQNDEAANTTETSFQNNDVNSDVTRSE